MKLLSIILFGLTYLLLLLLPKKRPYIALTTAIIFLILGISPLVESLTDPDSWNVLLMIAGTMGIVWLFIESKMPNLLADILIEKTPNVKWAIVYLALFTGLISAFVDNVATVLMVAPVAITIAKKLKISPVPIIIAISISSNLQGAATLVGDTTSILLGVHAKMDFLDFFFFNGKVGIFWVVEIGAIAATLLLLIVFRKEKSPIEKSDRTKVTNYLPTILLLGVIILLILASFIPGKPRITNGLICMILFVIGLIITYFQKKDKNVFIEGIKEIDYQTILLLFGLFIIIGGLSHIGVVQDIGNLFSKLSNNVFLVYSVIVWGSVLISAFIDNIPYVMAMLPVVGIIATNLGPNVDPNLLYFGLLIGATLGGNITPIGASANIAGIGILRKEGHEVKVWDFMKISIPFTLTAVITGYLLNWLIWA